MELTFFTQPRQVEYAEDSISRTTSNQSGANVQIIYRYGQIARSSSAALRSDCCRTETRFHIVLASRRKETDILLRPEALTRIITIWISLPHLKARFRTAMLPWSLERAQHPARPIL